MSVVSLYNSTQSLTFQLSLDQKNLSEAIELANIGVEAGVHVLEAGTILILSEGSRHVLPTLKARFPDQPLVADVKCTDGVGPEVGLMFELGASKATVMASASDASIRSAVHEASLHPGCQVMVDTMGFGGADGRNLQGQVDAAKRIRDLGAHYVVLHLGYDERNANRAMVDDSLLLKWAEAVAHENLGIPIQVVGGLTMAQAAQLPQFGITEIVISMNLGSAPVEDMRYDSITAFTVNLNDAADRVRVAGQIHQFIAGVAEQHAG